MQYLALASDYDGTLATRGEVPPDVVAALEKVQQSGRKLILVTGRELKDLIAVFPEYKMFDRLVVENGAVLYKPETGEELPLAEPPSELLVSALQARGVTPLSVGRCIIATWEPHETTALNAIKELGLELQVIFNKGAVMILPAGINKSSGVKAALKDLGLTPNTVVGVGDAENDHAFLRECGLPVAVRNALPSVKEEVAFVTENERGQGVIELIDKFLVDAQPSLQ